MAWSVEFARKASDDLDRLDPPQAKRILRFLDERLQERRIRICLERRCRDGNTECIGFTALGIIVLSLRFKRNGLLCS